MKKVKLLLAVLVMAIVFTGCAKSPEEVLSNATDKMSTLDNYHMVLDMKYEISYQDSSIETSVTMNSDVDEKNGISHSTASTSIFGMKIETELYTTLKDNIVTTYTKEDDVWYKEETKNENNDFNYDVFKNATSVEKLKDVDTETYKVVLSEAQIKEILKDLELDADEDMDKLKINLDTTNIEITIDDNYITKMMMIIPMTFEEDGEVSNSKYTLIYDFSQFNEVGNLTIPNEIIENAVDNMFLE